MLHTGIYIAHTEKKGRGVFTENPIPANTLVEVSPVIVLTPKDRQKIDETALYYYIFEWSEEKNQGALALGYISIYNHASPANCEYLMDFESQTISIQAMRDILAGEELTINYSAGWEDWKPVWFDEAT